MITSRKLITIIKEIKKYLGIFIKIFFIEDNKIRLIIDNHTYVKNEDEILTILQPYIERVNRVKKFHENI